MVQKCTICNQVVNCDDMEEHIKDKHSDKECEMCHKKFKQEEIEKHREKCDSKMMECQFCGLKLEKKELFEHEYECGAKTELCKKCGKFIPLRDMIDHQNKICVDILIYEGQGKKELIKRNVNIEDSLDEEEDKKELDKDNIQKERNEVRDINRINIQEDRHRRNEINNDRYQIRKREECVNIDSLKEQYNQMNDVFNRLNDFNMNLYNEINHSHNSSHSKHGNHINKPYIERLVNKYSKNNDKQKKKYSNIMDNRHYNYQEPKKVERKKYNYEREHFRKYEDKNKSKNIERPKLERIPFEDKFIYNKYKPMNEDDYYRKQIPEKEVSNHSKQNHKKVVQPVNRINSQKKESTKPRSIRHQSQPSQNRKPKEVKPFDMGKYMDDYLPDDVFE